MRPANMVAFFLIVMAAYAGVNLYLGKRILQCIHVLYPKTGTTLFALIYAAIAILMIALNFATVASFPIDHNPKSIHEYGNEVDLVLSGHTHKGQLFPANLITKAIYTADYGHYQKEPGAPNLIVTSGAGTWGPPMRVGSNCEIVSISVF